MSIHDVVNDSRIQLIYAVGYKIMYDFVIHIEHTEPQICIYRLDEIKSLRVEMQLE